MMVRQGMCAPTLEDWRTIGRAQFVHAQSKRAGQTDERGSQTEHNWHSQQGQGETGKHGAEGTKTLNQRANQGKHASAERETSLKRSA